MAKRGRKSWKERLNTNNRKDIDLNYGTINGKYSKYKRGEVITDIKVLLDQKVVIWIDTTKNIEILKSLPLRIILNSLEHKLFYFAILKNEKDKSE